MTADERIHTFEQSVLLPALDEIAASPALGRDFAPTVVKARPAADAGVEELLASLAGALRRRAGPSIALVDRKVRPNVPAVAGRYVVTTFYEVAGDDAYASPGVMFWMKFNNKLHAFAHRYDNAVARHRVEEIQRTQVLNHVLNSLTFYKLYAWSDAPFPGYR